MQLYNVAKSHKESVLTLIVLSIPPENIWSLVSLKQTDVTWNEYMKMNAMKLNLIKNNEQYVYVVQRK